MRIPKKMGGNSPLAIEWNAMVDYLKSLRPMPGSGVTITHTSQGFTVNRKQTPRRDGTGTT